MHASCDDERTHRLHSSQQWQATLACHRESEHGSLPLFHVLLQATLPLHSGFLGPVKPELLWGHLTVVRRRRCFQEFDPSAVQNLRLQLCPR